MIDWGFEPPTSGSTVLYANHSTTSCTPKRSTEEFMDTNTFNTRAATSVYKTSKRKPEMKLSRGAIRGSRGPQETEDDAANPSGSTKHQQQNNPSRRLKQKSCRALMTAGRCSQRTGCPSIGRCHWMINSRQNPPWK